MASKGSISRERRERAAQLALAQKKKERKAIIISVSSIVAFLLIACIAGVIIYNLTNLPNTVCINVSYTDENGVLQTGDIIVELDEKNAPITVKNFKNLVKNGFYDGLTFHRIMEGFMIQGGCPEGTGYGGSGTNIKGEFTANGVNNPIKHVRGTISMARGDSYDSASSQFFIVHETSASNSYSLDGQYAAFGHVIEGMDVVDAIATQKTNSNNKPLNNVVINYVVFVD